MIMLCVAALASAAVVAADRRHHGRVLLETRRENDLADFGKQPRAATQISAQAFARLVEATLAETTAGVGAADAAVCAGARAGGREGGGEARLIRETRLLLLAGHRRRRPQGCG